MKYLVLLLSLFLCLHTAKGQAELGEEATISILTIGPGKALYDKFGHSAIRVSDPVNGRDYVFNYGTYDFNTPNFYTKFAQGKLLYSLSVESYDDFYSRYVRANRWVKEQTLNLSVPEKRRFFAYLATNSLPENKDYQYDFFYDNCATKIRDVLSEVLGNQLKYDDSFVEDPKTFRQLIQQNVHWNTWGSLGMDVAIGAVTDVQATAWDFQFLPDYVEAASAVATINRDGNRTPLVQVTKTLFQNRPQPDENPWYRSPFFIFSLLGSIIILITIKDFRQQARSRYLDGILFFTTGLIGIILALLWFATDHTATANNYNLLWAFPFNLLFTVAIARKFPKKWLRKYLVALLLWLCLMVLHSFTGVQQFALGFLPFFVALAVRYVYVMTFLNKQALLTSKEDNRA